MPSVINPFFSTSYGVLDWSIAFVTQTSEVEVTSNQANLYLPIYNIVSLPVSASYNILIHYGGFKNIALASDECRIEVEGGGISL